MPVAGLPLFDPPSLAIRRIVILVLSAIVQPPVVQLFETLIASLVAIGSRLLRLPSGVVLIVSHDALLSGLKC